MKKRIHILSVFILLIAVVIPAVYWLATSPRRIELPISRESPSERFDKALAAANFHPDARPVFADDSVFASLSGRTVIFSRDKDFNLQMRALQLVLGSLKMDSRNPKVIDLRFDKAVIRY